ncbi:MAG TPA: hypothetical protein VHR42_01780 [Clostridia bacterium]|nr:hypothetical protein [Clostridia bacterium]
MQKQTKDPTGPDNACLEKRLTELEREYDSKRDPANELRLEQLNFYLSGLLGRNNLHYLREYADLLIARYNIDAGWFYQKGYEDACRAAKRRS